MYVEFRQENLLWTGKVFTTTTRRGGEEGGRLVNGGSKVTESGISMLLGLFLPLRTDNSGIVSICLHEEPPETRAISGEEASEATF